MFHLTKLLAPLVVLSGLLGGSAAAAPAAPTAPAQAAPAPAVTKLLVVVEENHSLDQMRTRMPYTFRQARRFGYARQYTAMTHPSLPNYIAIAGGRTYGITDDAGPSAHPIQGTSVFGQARRHGRSAAVYAETMPRACAIANAGDYAVRHNPWAYFQAERSMCRSHDHGLRAFGRAAADGTLPRAGMLVPNLQHDAHDGTLAQADAFFKQVMGKVFAGPDWKSGHLAVVLTADEDDRHHGNRVLTVVIHPSQHSRVVRTALDHYSLTRLYDEVAHLPYLHRAASAPSMAVAFHLPLR
ncbi:MAG: alkaline phosphatase family protein [Nocardioidaceae bacterium]